MSRHDIQNTSYPEGIHECWQLAMLNAQNLSEQYAKSNFELTPLIHKSTQSGMSLRTMGLDEGECEVSVAVITHLAFEFGFVFARDYYIYVIRDFTTR